MSLGGGGGVDLIAGAEALRETGAVGRYRRDDRGDPVGVPLVPLGAVLALVATLSGVSVAGGIGSERVADAAPPSCDGVPATIVGTTTDDVLVGTADADVIWAGAGRDTVHAGDGDDIICGESGPDQLYGDGGADQIHGGPGRDFIWGGLGDDKLSGDLPDSGDGDTVSDHDDQASAPVHGAMTFDLMVGVMTGQGSDTLGGFENVWAGTDGLTTVRTAPSTRFVITGAGRSEVTTDVGDQSSSRLTLLGNGFDDHFVIRRPNVVADGGIDGDGGGHGGYDRYDVQTTAGTTWITDHFQGGEVHGGAGREIVNVMAQDERSTYVVDTGGGNDQVRVSVSRGNATVRTGAGNDILRPGAAGDPGAAGVLDVWLGPGNDQLTRTWSNRRSVIRGGAGTDWIIGRPGRDVIDLREGSWKPGAVLLRGFEAVWAMEGNDDIAGDAADNTLVGGPGNDAVSGRRGADRLAGNTGHDTLRGGPGPDAGNGGRGRDRCTTERRVSCEL